MHTPQLITLSLYALVCGLSLGKHGEPRTGNHNFFVDLIASALCITVLWWGGYFSQP